MRLKSEVMLGRLGGFKLSISCSFPMSQKGKRFTKKLQFESAHESARDEPFPLHAREDDEDVMRPLKESQTRKDMGERRISR